MLANSSTGRNSALALCPFILTLATREHDKHGLHRVNIPRYTDTTPGTPTFVRKFSVSV
jgi:hypothetical protein